MNGWRRDTPQMFEQNWPVFSCDCYAQDSSVCMQVVSFRHLIEFGDVWVDPDDIMFGNINGVLTTPQEYETEAFERASEKAADGKVV